MGDARRVTFLRHAMPEVDAAVPPSRWRLSAEGVRSSSALRHALAGFAGSVVSSPERKALQTCALALGIPASAVPTDPGLREVDRVERVSDDFREARRAWVAGHLDERHHGWETPDAAARRFHESLLSHPAEHLVVGTHGMALTAWMVAQRRVAPGDSAVEFWESLGLPHLLDVDETFVPPS